MKRGSIVYDVADPRHLGMIKNIAHRGYDSIATVKWLETGWKSVGLPLTDLRLAEHDHDVPTEIDILRARLR